MGTGVVICLGRGADLYMAPLMPLPLTVSCFSKSILVLPFWYRLTRVVPDMDVIVSATIICCQKGAKLSQFCSTPCDDDDDDDDDDNNGIFQHMIGC